MLFFKTLKNKLKTISLVIVMLLISFESVTAATKYWIGTGANSNWNTSTNWSNTSGGATCTCVPAATDIAIFDGGGNNACTIGTSTTIGTLTITSGYTNTITQSNTFSIGTGGASLSGGTFAGYTGSGSANMTCAGNFTISGTAFTSTKNSFTLGANFTLSSGSFTHNSGTTVFATTKTITGSTTFYNLTLGTPSGSAATHTISSGTILTVSNTLTLSTTNAITINTGDIEAQGDITITNTASGGGGSALIKINGTGTQTLTGSGVANTGNLCKVEVNKSAGTLNLASIISIANDWTYTTGTVSSGTSTLDACASLNMDCQGSGGTMSLYNLTTYTGTTTLTGDVGINNNLTINNSTTLSASSYGIYLNGQWTNNGTFTYGTGNVVFQGTSLQTINTSNATETFYNLTMNKTSGRVLLNDPTLVNNSVTFTEGIIKASSGNYFKLIDNATASAGNDSAFVYGYYKKIGDEAFTFALGDTSVSTGGYHPLSIGAPSSATDAYTAQYFNSGQTYSSARDSILNYTSTCEYWNLARDIGSSNVTVKLGWNSASCNIDSLSDLRVAYWDGTKWRDKGGSYTGTVTIGDVVTSSAQSSFGNFIIAKKYLNANAGADVTICSGSSTNLTGTTGTSYIWSPTTALSCSTCNNPTASPTSTITYAYTVTYASGYQSSDTIIVTVIATPTASAGIDTIMFIGESLAIGGSPTASGGTTPYTYAWSPTTALSSSTVANPVSSALTTTTYVVTVTGNNGCLKRDTMTLTVDTLLPYFGLASIINSSYQIVKNNTLCFAFEEEYISTGDSLRYTIYTDSNSVLVTDLTNGPPLYINNGQNNFRIKLNTISGVTFNAGYYMLEVTNRKKEKMYLRFKV